MTLPAIEVATAYHEAGHAVMAMTLGRSVDRVSVLPNQLRLGQCELRKGRVGRAKDAAETDMLVLLAGLAAEALHIGEYSYAGAAQDLRGVRSMLRNRPGSTRQLERFERRLLDKAEHLLGDAGVWLAVERIAAELMRSTTISGRAAKQLYEQAISAAERDE